MKYVLGLGNNFVFTHRYIVSPWVGTRRGVVVLDHGQKIFMETYTNTILLWYT